MKRFLLTTVLVVYLFQPANAYAATYVENFTNGSLSTAITIKQNGVDIGISSPSNSDGVEAQYNNKYQGQYGVTGYYLNLHMVTSDVTITFPSNARPTSFSFIASIVNGTQNGSYTYTDGTTTNFSIPNTVSSFVNHFTTLTITGDGRPISYFKIIGGGSNDYWTLDDLTWSANTITQSTTSLTGPTTAIYRTGVTLSATVNTAGKITFYADKKRIPGCISLNVVTTVTCRWMPSVHKSYSITAQLTPTDSSYLSSTSNNLIIAAGLRTNNR